MKKRAADWRDGNHYMKDHKWLSGELCYWRNNANYSDKTKVLLEKRMKDMVDPAQMYEIYRRKQ